MHPSLKVILLCLVLGPASAAAQDSGRPSFTGTVGTSRSRGGAELARRDARMADAMLTWQVRSGARADLLTGVTLAITRNEAYDRNCDDPVVRRCDVFPPLNFLGVPVGVSLAPHRAISIAPYLVPGLFAGDYTEPSLGLQARLDGTAAITRRVGAVVSGRAAGLRVDGDQVSLLGVTFGLRFQF